MKNTFKKMFWMFIILIIFVSVAALIAKAFGIPTNEMILFMLVSEYANRVYDNIIDD